MVELSSERLRLLALDLRHLRLMRQSRDLMEEALGLLPMTFQVDKEMATEIRQAIDFWLINVESRPEHYAWYTNWEIILPAENRSIGGIGLSGRPDEEGKVMTGYFIDARYYNQGFATEALQTLIEWAFRDPALAFLTAETPHDHYASHRVLIKNQFEPVQEADQLVIWERPAGPAKASAMTAREGQEG
jgi:RimJ/RimL family protein N-acetyltransferase